MLHGRDAVLRACRAALQAAVAGHGRVLLLTGEAGIGKTTVAHALTEAAEEAGALTRWSGCWEGGSVPFAPWIELLRRPGDDPCSEVAAQLAEGEIDAGGDPSSLAYARLRLFARVADALRAVGEQRAQVAVIEDVHWADAASLLLLQAVATQISGMRVLVVATYRDDETTDETLRALSGATERVAIERLATDDVGRLLADVLGRSPSAEETAAVDGHTAGNPLLVTHVGRLIAAGAALGVPAGVRDILARRLARLPTESDAALGAAAVLGSEFEPAVVARMLDRPENEVLAALDAAAVARICVPVAGSADRWTFTHALLQATRYELLGSSERTALHRRACELLAETGSVPARVLVHHAFRGRFDAQDPRPAQLALAAAEDARGRLAVEEAASLYEQALERAPAGRAGDEVRAQSWLGLGETRLRTADAAGAADAFEAAADIAREHDDAELLARAALGFGAGLGGFEVRMFDQRQTSLLEQAAVALEEASPLRPWILARLSVALSYVGDQSRRRELTDQALALARQAHDPAAIAAALASRCDAIAGPAFVHERLGLAGEIISIALGLGDRRLELLGRRLRVAALAEVCDMAGLDAEVAAFERTAAALGDPLYSWYGPLWRGMRALSDGRIGDAELLREEARATGAQAGSGNARVLTTVQELCMGLETADTGQFQARFERVASDFPELVLANGGPMFAFMQSLVDAPGWRQRASEAFDAVDSTTVDAEWLCTVGPLTDLVEKLELPDVAADLYGRFAPFTGLGVVEGIAAMHRGATDRYLMVLAAMSGDDARALEHVDRALAVGGRVGSLVLAGTQQAAAGVLRRLGGAQHDARARELQEQAHQTFRRLGLTARATGPAEPPQTPPAEAGFVREGDTWAVTWRGDTVRIRHAKGVVDLSVLLGRPGREVHVRELEGIADQPAGLSRQALVDQTAVEQYRRRLRDLEEDLDEADRHADTGRAAALRTERDALIAELSRAFGLAGRDRGAGPDPDERLRKAVSGRIKVSIDRFEQLHPGLGRHLRNSVRTGVWCSYVPEKPVSWKVVG